VDGAVRAARLDSAAGAGAGVAATARQHEGRNGAHSLMLALMPGRPVRLICDSCATNDELVAMNELSLTQSV
jgi:hypothetical protein